ncbi:hypothetical protein D3C77_450740 [compost metagenome]
MCTAAHGAAIDFRQGEGGAFRGHDNVGSAGNTDATAQDKAMHGNDHRHRRAVYGLERGVVAGVDRNDLLRVGVQFLDIDPGTKTTAFGTDDDHPHFGVGAQGFHLQGQVHPFLAIQGIDRRFSEHQFSNARVDLCSKCLTHDGLLQCSAGVFSTRWSSAFLHLCRLLLAVASG